MKVLLVDDSRPARQFIKNTLSEINIGQAYDSYDFVEVETGEAALNMIQTRRIDIVFLDWNMNTEMTGLDVLKEIRKIEKFKNLPIIMVTSDGDKSRVIESLKYGANDYFVKPIDLKIFKEKISKIIRNIYA